MTLTAKVLPPSQIDTTLCNISRYLKLVKEANKIKSPAVKERVMYMLNLGYENANDTILMEKACPLTEWDDMFRDTIQGCMDCLHSHFPRTGHKARAYDATVLWFFNRLVK